MRPQPGAWTQADSPSTTHEVYGSLAPDANPCREDCRYAPNSPYAASKAASDHLVRAYAATYGLPVSITNCCNNYGPFQFPEKLVALALLNAMEGQAIPLYGVGGQIRDWVYVEDHCEGKSPKRLRDRNTFMGAAACRLLGKPV